MPSPSSSLATLRPDLAQSFMEFNLAMDQQGFIALQVCPVLEVDRASGNFGRIPIEQLLQKRSTKRGPGGGYNRGSWKFEPDTYATTEHGLEEPIDDNEEKMYASYFDVEQVSAARAYDGVLRDMERRVAALHFDPSTWTGADLTTTASHLWSDHDNATPIDDVLGAVKKVYANSGMWPTSLVLHRLLVLELQQCAQIIDRIKFWGGDDPKADEITPQVLAQIFQLRELIVAGSTDNVADEGQAVDLEPIWDPSMAQVARIDRSIDVRRPTVTRCFHWGEDGSTIGGTVETYRDETIRGDVVRVRNQTHEKRMYTEAAHLLQGLS